MDIDRGDQDESAAEAKGPYIRLTLPACGGCHFCGESVNTGEIFCDAACERDWRRQRDADRAYWGGDPLP